jgi:hypothetical protein
MAKYDGAISTALALIQRKGTSVTVTRHTDGGFDPVTQAETAPSDQSETFQCVGLPPGRAAEYRVGSLAGKNAIELYFAQKDRTMRPSPGDRISFQGATWTIFWSQTYDPAGDGAILTIAYAER